MRTLAPEVGAIVEYGLDSFGKKPQTYRVDSWMRERAPLVKAKRGDFSDVIDEILYDAQQEIKGKKMEWCLRHEATHLSLSGICGAVAPIEECKVVGMVTWSKELLDHERKQARELGFRRAQLF